MTNRASTTAAYVETQNPPGQPAWPWGSYNNLANATFTGLRSASVYFNILLTAYATYAFLNNFIVLFIVVLLTIVLTSMILYLLISCPYLILSTSEDQPGSYLELLYDPEYTLFYGCQCGQVKL